MRSPIRSMLVTLVGGATLSVRRSSFAEPAKHEEHHDAHRPEPAKHEEHRQNATKSTVTSGGQSATRSIGTSAEPSTERSTARFATIGSIPTRHHRPHGSSATKSAAVTRGSTAATTGAMVATAGSADATSASDPGYRLARAPLGDARRRLHSRRGRVVRARSDARASGATRGALGAAAGLRVHPRSLGVAGRRVDLATAATTSASMSASAGASRAGSSATASTSRSKAAGSSESVDVDVVVVRWS